MPDVPMMPVVHGAAATARQILVYSVVLLAVTLAPGLVGTFGVVYLAAAAVLGAVLCVLALRLRRATGPANAALMFHFSLLYLALLFVALAVDPLV